MQFYLLSLLISAPVCASELQNSIASHSDFEIAVIINPIADMHNSFPAPDNVLPASPQTNKCHRAHQGLFNELVSIIEEREDQAKIAFPNIVYGFDAVTQQPLNTFWIHKRYIIPLNNLAENLLQTIPSPQYANGQTVVLIYPWRQFSVGTRFKRTPQHDSQSHYAIVRADYSSQREIVDFIPHEDAIPEIKQDSQSARRLFLQIINNLIDRVAAGGTDNVVPYVWGGSSFAQPYSKLDFYLQDGVWHRNGKHDPYTGYDCSEFVLRMAQIAGIHFPWKTTKVIGQSLRSLNNQDQLEEGDLIWVEGHVMIVSDIEQNEIIEMCGYSSGYGCLHRIQLKNRFAEITTYADLLEYYHKNKPITFKNKQGVPVQKSNAVKLLKLVD